MRYKGGSYDRKKASGCIIGIKEKKQRREIKKQKR